MERTHCESWLEKYGNAWRGRNPQAAADLFAEDGTYQVTPFVEPMRGRSAIFDYWTHVAETERTSNLDTKFLLLPRRQASPDGGRRSLSFRRDCKPSSTEFS
jgi:hypothetical protein